MNSKNHASKKLSKKYQEQLEAIRLYLQAVGYKKGSQKAIRAGIKEFLGWLEKQEVLALEEVNKERIKAYASYLENRPNKIRVGGLSSGTIRSHLFGVEILFKQLEQQGDIVCNPMSSYRLPKVESEARSILTLEEIEQLYGVCENLKERCFLHLYYGLGLRRSEGVALRIGDVDYKKGWLFVQKGKGGKGRNMPLSKQLQKELKHYLLEERPRVSSNALMLNHNQEKMQGYSALIFLRKLLKRADLNLKIDLHSLRHSIASHLIGKGMPLEQVREYLGHSHLESTQRYVHYAARRLSKKDTPSLNSKEL